MERSSSFIRFVIMSLNESHTSPQLVQARCSRHVGLLRVFCSSLWGVILEKQVLSAVRSLRSLNVCTQPNEAYVVSAPRLHPSGNPTSFQRFWRMKPNTSDIRRACINRISKKWSMQAEGRLEPNVLVSEGLCLRVACWSLMCRF